MLTVRAAFISELAKAEKKIDNFETNTADFLDRRRILPVYEKLMPGGSMVETRKTMLKIHDNDKARRVTKNDTIETESIVMSGLF